MVELNLKDGAAKATRRVHEENLLDAKKIMLGFLIVITYLSVLYLSVASWFWLKLGVVMQSRRFGWSVPQTSLASLLRREVHVESHPCARQEPTFYRWN